MCLRASWVSVGASGARIRLASDRTACSCWEIWLFGSRRLRLLVRSHGPAVNLGNTRITPDFPVVRLIWNGVAQAVRAAALANPSLPVVSNEAVVAMWQFASVRRIVRPTTAGPPILGPPEVRAVGGGWPELSRPIAEMTGAPTPQRTPSHLKWRIRFTLRKATNDHLVRPLG